MQIKKKSETFKQRTEIRERTDPGTGNAIPVDVSAYIPITTAAAETNTMAVPTFLGQTMLLNCVTYAVGDRVVTVADPHIDGTNNTIAFTAAGQAICLVGIKATASTLGWALAWNRGTTLSHA